MAQLKNTTINDTSNLSLPSGTTAQRPSSPNPGMIRYNTTLNDTEYYDGVAWRSISDTGVEATGGTIIDTEIGGVPYRIHTFTATGNSTFTVTKGGEVEYLIVAGGGAGGAEFHGGGGGAGGLLTGTTAVTPQAYTITVGAGGAATTSGAARNSGQNSSAFGQTSIGGGGGGSSSARSGLNGGSGGGLNGGTIRGVVGTGTTGQGFNGGIGSEHPSDGSSATGGGGGGAGQPGGAGTSNTKAGDGGAGITSSITGISQFYAGGGGGGSQYTGGIRGFGGLGGGGNGGEGSGSAPTLATEPGTPNTGSGGGGASAGSNTPGAAGGSGIIVVRYRRNASTTTIPTRTVTSTLPNNFTIVQNGLVLNLDATNPVSYPGTGTVWQDLSKYGNNGTFSGTVGFNSSNSGTLVFNGTDSQVIIPHSSSLKPTSTITLSAWVNTDWQTTNNVRILSCTEGGGWQLSLNDIAGQVGMTIHIGGTYRYPGVPKASISPGYHNIVGTFDGRFAKLYIDAVLVSNLDLGSTLLLTYAFNNVLVIGAEAGSSGSANSNFIAGTIPAVKIYNRDLSQLEIVQNFNALRGRYGI